MPSTERWRWIKHHVVAGGIAFITGYADVVSLKRWQCFCGMLTGNTIWLGRVLAGEKGLHGPLFYVAIILSFFLGVALHRWADMRWTSRGASRVGTAIGLLGFAIEIFMLFWGHSAMAFSDAKWAVLFYVPLFGVITSASSDGRLGVTTTMVTGHVTKLGQASVSWPGHEHSYVDKCKLMVSLTVWLSVAAGACTAILVLRQRYFDTAGAFLPVLPTLILLLLLLDHLTLPRKGLKKLAKKVKQVRARSQERMNEMVSHAVGHSGSLDSELNESSEDSDSSDDEPSTERGEGTDPGTDTHLESEDSSEAPRGAGALQWDI